VKEPRAPFVFTTGYVPWVFFFLGVLELFTFLVYTKTKGYRLGKGLAPQKHKTEIHSKTTHHQEKINERKAKEDTVVLRESEAAAMS
jgi:hypothetical protein